MYMYHNETYISLQNSSMCGCSLVLRYPEHPSHSFTESEKKTEMLVYFCVPVFLPGFSNRRVQYVIVISHPGGLYLI